MGAISRGKRVAAAAMVQSGIPCRQVGAELGISYRTAARAAHDPSITPEEIEQVRAKLQSRLLMASDRFLTQSLSHIQDLGPYQAMLCAGIAHDHYLRSRAAASGNQGGSLTHILIQIDQQARGQREE